MRASLWALGIFIVINGPIALAQPGQDFGSLESNGVFPSAVGISDHQVTSFGDFSYSYNVEVPPGRNGFSPVVTLMYTSSNKRGPLGDGWSLSIPYIIRSKRLGVPTYDDLQDEFQYVDFDGTTKELIRVGGQVGNQIRFRLQADTSLAWYILRTDTNTWKVLNTNGSTMEFGRGGSPHYARYDVDNYYHQGTMAWYISEIRSSTNDLIEYFYQHGGPQYGIEVISYGKHESTDHFASVVFYYSDNANPIVENCRYGAGQSWCEYDAKILTSIHTNIKNSTGTWDIERKYQVAISEGATPGSKNLYSIQQYSKNNIPLPPIEFTYGEFSYNPSQTQVCFDPSEPQEAYWGESVSDPNPPHPKMYGLSRQTRTLIDINGDGIDDLVKSSPADQGYRVYLGGYTSENTFRFALSEVWSVPQPNQSDYATCAFYPVVDGNFPISTSYSQVAYFEFVYQYIFTNQVQALIDMNGDGRPDWVRVVLAQGSNCPAMFYLAENTKLLVAYNNGHGFGEIHEIDLPDHVCGLETVYIENEHNGRRPWKKYEVNQCMFADVDGDRFPDIVKNAFVLDNIESNGRSIYNYFDYLENNSVSSWLIYKNRNSYFDSIALQWDVEADSLRSSYMVCEPGFNGCDNSFPQNKYLISDIIDVNGDGFIDFVNQEYFDTQNFAVKHYPGLGDRLWSWPWAHENINLDWFFMTSTYHDQLGEEEFKVWPIEHNAFFVDVNNDSLPDRLHFQEGYIAVHMNNGTYYNDLEIVENVDGDVLKSYSLNKPPEWTDARTLGLRLTRDINGDGNVDHLALSGGILSYDQHQTFQCWPIVLSNATAGTRLVKIENNSGLRTHVTYKPAVRALENNFPLKGKYVIDQVTTTDFITGNTRTLTYKFSGADVANDYLPIQFDNPCYNRFGGFRNTEINDSATGNRTTIISSQNCYLVGSQESVIVRNSSGEILAENENVFDAFALLGLPSTTRQPRLSEQRYTEYEIGSQSESKTIESLYFYNQSSGLPTSIVNHGDLQAQGDERIFTYIFKSNVSLENETYIYGVKTKEIWENQRIQKLLYYHDGFSDLSGMSDGLLTQVREYYGDGSSDYRHVDYDYFPGTSNLSRVTDTKGIVTEFTYDETSQSKVESVASGAHSSTAVWDLGTGNLLSRTDENGQTWETKYDEFGRPLQVYTPADSGARFMAAQYTYADWIYYNSNRYENPQANYIEVSSIVEFGQPWGVTRIYVDGHGRELQNVSLHNGSQYVSTYVKYDDAGRLWRQRNPEWSTSLDYNPNVTWNSEGADGERFVQITYDALGRVSQATDQCSNAPVVFTYKPLEYRSSDQIGKTRKVVRDGLGRTTRIALDPDGIECSNAYSYSGNRVTRVEDWLGNSMAYAYNLAGDLVQAKVQEQALSPMSRTYQYHVSGDLSSTYTNSGRKISYSGFDSYGRLVKSRVLVGANVHYTDESAYDKGLNGVGRLTGMWRKDANGNLLKKSAYAYTNRGLPEYYESFIKATGATYGVSFGYNEGAMLKGLVYPNGQSVSYTYNPDGTALRVDDDKTGLPIATVTEYNARRQPVRISFANESGDEYYYHYNPCGNVDALNVYNDSVLVRSESIVYRDNGEIASITDEINGQTQSMDYDFAGRLSSWITTGPLGQTTEEYLYDGLSSSEMTASIRNGVVTERHYTLANNPWAVSETVVNGIANSYSYDSDGNLLGIPAFTYAYDAEGKLATATKRGSTTTWNYGPGGELYHKNTVGPLGSNRVEYIGELYERRSVDGDRTKEEEICHVMLGGMRIAAIVNQAKGGSFILRMHGDRLDSVDSIQNYDGSQLRSARYYPFGELLSSSGTTVLDEFQFNGRRNEGFGFLRFPARIYIPSLKQWSSLDPLVMSAPNVMVRVGISPYAYVDNEPIGKIDLFGLDPTTIFGAPSGGSFGDILGGPPGPAFYNIGPPAIVNPLNADGVDTTQYWDMSPAEVARLGQGGNRIEGKKKWKPPYMGEKLPHFNVSSENEMLGFQEDMFGWGPLASMAVHLWWLIESKDILGRPVARSHAAVLVGGDVFDGALWYMSCATGGAGRAAGGARAAAQQAPNVVKGLGNITHAGKLTPDVALSAAQRWLGPGYRELAPGVYRSVDNLRQFRMVTSDLVGAHGKIGPHVHFQAFDDLGVVVENLHVPIFP